jgi:hypothetical protein
MAFLQVSDKTTVEARIDQRIRSGVRLTRKPASREAGRACPFGRVAIAAVAALATASGCEHPPPPEASLGRTEIAKWQDGKPAALSITFDDGSANQFRVAVPILRRRDLPATFFVVTGEVGGSSRRGRFVGRPLAEIVRESSATPTSDANFFERATARRYAPYEEAAAPRRLAGRDPRGGPGKRVRIVSHRPEAIREAE